MQVFLKEPKRKKDVKNITEVFLATLLKNDFSFKIYV